jgi:hypothetical protein
MLVNASAREAIPINLAGDTDRFFLAIYVGTAGDIVVDTIGGNVAVVFQNVPVGILPVQVSRIYSTANGTTAADLIGLTW